MSVRVARIIPPIILVILIVVVVIVQKNIKLPKDGVAVSAAKIDRKITGPHNAPITIVEFSDFQCPSCALSQQPLKELMAQFPEMIKVEFRHFPLEMHRFAGKAALFAECALDQGNFWEYQDLLFKEQSVWSRDPDPEALFLAFGNNLDMNSVSLIECQKNPSIDRRVRLDKQSGDALNVQSTPTFFINNERVVGGKQLKENGPEIIKKALQQTIQNRS